MIETENFFDLQKIKHPELFRRGEPVWTALDKLGNYLAKIIKPAFPEKYCGLIREPLVFLDNKFVSNAQVSFTEVKGIPEVTADGKILAGAACILPGAFIQDTRLQIGAGSIVEAGALIKGPTIIGKNTEVRQGAYIRGNCLIGDNCVVGHTTEIKGSIMLDGAKAGHFAYIGNSILGFDVNLGAGTKLANLKMIPGTIQIMVTMKRVDTKRRKLGAIIGDGCETGCNSVTSPGTFLGPKSVVYPAIGVPAGVYPAKTTIMPSRESITVKQH